MGLPIALLFLAKDATVTVAHSKTPQAELQGTGDGGLWMCTFICGWNRDLDEMYVCMYVVGTHPCIARTHTHTYIYIHIYAYTPSRLTLYIPTIPTNHTRTHTALCAQSDIVVGAVGVPRLIKAEWLKPGALAVNVGTTFSPEEKAMVGDIDRRGIEQVKGGISRAANNKPPNTHEHEQQTHTQTPNTQQVTNLLTPSPYVDPATGKVAPSGIGPLTLPVLLRSVLEAAKCVFFSFLR